MGSASVLARYPGGEPQDPVPGSGDHIDMGWVLARMRRADPIEGGYLRSPCKGSGSKLSTDRSAHRLPPHWSSV